MADVDVVVVTPVLMFFYLKVSRKVFKRVQFCEKSASGSYEISSSTVMTSGGQQAVSFTRFYLREGYSKQTVSSFE